jgi:glycosyl transferase family 2
MAQEVKARKPIVAVPVRDEAERLPALIEALDRQTWTSQTGHVLPVIFVLNNCHDDSARVLKAASARSSRLALSIIDVHFPSHCAHVGSARRLAMEEALRMAGRNSVLLTTDADAVPASNWIETNLRAIEQGADLVGGCIIGDREEEAVLGSGFVQRATRHLHYARLVDQFAALINPVPHDPWPRHSDHTGASLAVRGEVYQAVGGMPALPFREDIAFVSAVCRAGYRLRHPLDVKVVVSARLEGRAAGGMADCLKAWVDAAAQGRPHLVDDPLKVAAHLHRRRFARSGDENVPIICATLGDELSDIESDAQKEIDIELAIKRIEQMIKASEDKTRVT